MRTKVFEKPEILLWRYGKDILHSDAMQMSQSYRQHGTVSVYEHSADTAKLCLRLARATRLRIDVEAMTRGALLHDYFLYDWHEKDVSHAWHGFTHAKTAAKNAERDFSIGEIERDMIEHHMFPLNIRPPKFREAWILCCADKMCSVYEVAKSALPQNKRSLIWI